jgi:hypothetical protein
MVHKIILAALILFMCLTMSGCKGSSVQVSQVAPIESNSSLSDRTVEIRNCDGTTELHRSLAAEAQVERQITIADIVTAVASGDSVELSPDIKTLLTDQIDQAYSQVYGEVKTEVERTEMVVPIGKIRTYKVYWKQQVFSSTLSFPINDEMYIADYRYTLDIPHVIITTEISCTA